jgi:hypothetical protein
MDKRFYKPQVLCAGCTVALLFPIFFISRVAMLFFVFTGMLYRHKNLARKSGCPIHIAQYNKPVPFSFFKKHIICLRHHQPAAFFNIGKGFGFAFD